jgi:hypothetical protein
VRVTGLEPAASGLGTRRATDYTSPARLSKSTNQHGTSGRSRTLVARFGGAVAAVARWRHLGVSDGSRTRLPRFTAAFLVRSDTPTIRTIWSHAPDSNRAAGATRASWSPTARPSTLALLTGLEPAHPALPGRSSASRHPTAWRWRRGSNPHLLAYEASCLPLDILQHGAPEGNRTPVDR